MMTHLRYGIYLMVMCFSVTALGNSSGRISYSEVKFVYSNIVQRLNCELRGPYKCESLGDKVFNLNYKTAFKKTVKFLNRDLHIKTIEPKIFDITIRFHTDNLLIYSLGVLWDNESGNPSCFSLNFHENNQLVPLSRTNTVRDTRKDESDLERPAWAFEFKQFVAPFMRTNTCWVLEVDTESQSFVWDPLDGSVNTNVCRTLNTIDDVFRDYDLEYVFLQHRPIDSSSWICRVSLVKRGHDHEILDRYNIIIDGEGRIIHPIHKRERESAIASGRVSEASDTAKGEGM